MFSKNKIGGSGYLDFQGKNLVKFLTRNYMKSGKP